MKWALDTSIVSLYMRRTEAVVARWRAVQAQDIVIPTIVVAEGYAGACRMPVARYRQGWQTMIDSYELLPFGAEAALCYGEIRAKLEVKGCMIGDRDCQIAATALAWQQTHPDETITLVTDNTREFKRVMGLKVVNWAQE